MHTEGDYITKISRAELYDLILKSRIAIARIGEKNCLNWWDADAQSDDALYALKRLFRNTYQWAAMEIAMQCAKTKIEGLLPTNINPIHLFNLTFKIDSDISNIFYNAKKVGTEVNNYFFVIPSTKNPISVLLEQFFEDFPSIESYEEKMHEINETNLLSLGNISEPDLEDLNSLYRIVNTLTAGFSLSKLGKLIVPFYEFQS